jgi:hypothetical protein
MILSGVITALASASLMAQVYSLNAVGYINVTIPPGFSIIADQLYATNQSTPQFISPLLDTQLLDGNHIGVTFFKFNPAGGGTYTIVNVTPTGWGAPSGIPATSISLNPGEGCYIYNPLPTFTLTFVGQVPQGTTLTNTLQPGFNMVSSIVPQQAAIDTVLGLTPTIGDTIFLYNVSASSYDIMNWTPTGWQTVVGPEPTGTAPSPAVGAGFFYYANIANGTTEVWNRSFQVN